MIFFSPPSLSKFSHHLIHYDDFITEKENPNNILFIDPQVHYLERNIEYPHIHELHKIVPNLQSNQYISIDYPSDMNPSFSDLFIKKTYENNIKYSQNDQYICTVQFPISNYIKLSNGKLIAKPSLHDFEAFVNNYNKIKHIVENNPNKILGIGNICKIRTICSFTDELMDFILEKRHKLHWIHFYGISLNLIKYYLKHLDRFFKISVDNVKWTFPNTPLLAQEFKNRSCNKFNKETYFMAYINKIKQKGIKIIL